VALALFVVALLLSDDPAPPSATEMLGRAQAFVRRATSVEYSLVVGLGASGDGPAPHTFDSEESAIFPDRGRSMTTVEGTTIESVVIGDVTYLRESEGATGLSSQPWTRFEPEDSTLGFGGLIFLEPQKIPEAIGAARDPKILRRRPRSVVLDVRFDPKRFLGPIDSAEGTLAIEQHGRIVGLDLRLRAEGQPFTVTYDFVDWNRELSIAAPAESDVDVSPLYDEAAIAGYEDIELFQPVSIPEGWGLTGAEVVPQLAELVTCDAIALDFTPVDLRTEGYLSIYEFPSRCSPGPPPLSEAFVAGPHTGWIGDDFDDATVVALLPVRGTGLVVFSDLPRGQVIDVLANLEPLDLYDPPGDDPLDA
jgi:hypothetical protein